METHLDHDKKKHIETIMRLAEQSRPNESVLTHDDVIRNSWMRCIHEHKLDPTRSQEAIILPYHQLREHQDQIDDFLHIARHGLETLYHQVTGLGYAVLLTDAHGVTVDFIGDIQLDKSLRKAGLYLGSNWNEMVAGTCGVGTCITTGVALTVHLNDHFDATHIPLTCTAAPIFDPQGKLKAVLDISALTSPHHKESQHLALQLVKMFAHQIENAHFLHRFTQDWILRLSLAPEFLEVDPEFLVAVDTAGKIIGHNHRAQLLFCEDGETNLIGRSVDQILNLAIDELPRFVSAKPADRRAVRMHGSQKLLFVSALSPTKVQAGSHAGKAEMVIPAPLAALSGGDTTLDRQIDRAAKLVNSPISVLITGETGSGKEFFAKALHKSSERRDGPFIPVNCAAIPENLIESELFGYTAGSFSGAATKGKRGLIQEADGGTLFLDEIGDMPKPLQARLLRVLSEREVLPIGATQAAPVNIRVVAATHCDLENLVVAGLFRDDLYYRLCGAHFTLPPLRDRKDMAWVIDRVLAINAKQNASPFVPELDKEAREILVRHRWPGNLRELNNVIAFATSVSSEKLILATDLPEYLLSTERFSELDLPVDTDSVFDHEKSRLLALLRGCRWNVTAAAQQMGISRVTIYKKMKRYNVKPPI